uniref:Uncharacterized protein n=1 Tax=Arundo donax TaxID=35708 RepID=A0A0A9EJN7_ARUDO
MESTGSTILQCTRLQNFVAVTRL